MPKIDDGQPALDQPGLDRLREALANHPEQFPGGTTLRRDALAGLNTAIAYMPDGLATGILGRRQIRFAD